MFLIFYHYVFYILYGTLQSHEKIIIYFLEIIIYLNLGKYLIKKSVRESRAMLLFAVEYKV